MTPISVSRLAALSGPAIPMFAMMMPLVIFIPPFFADEMGLGMVAVGAIFTIGRFFDVATDPFAGFVMDKTRSRIPKKLWVILGAIPLALGVWQIFFVADTKTETTLLAWLLFLYVGWTLMSVGLYSWASEISDDYHERSRVMGAIQMANGAGSIAVLLIPALIEILMPDAGVAALRIKAMGGAILLMLPVTLIVAWFFAPSSRHIQARDSVPFFETLRYALSNSALRRLLVADFAVGLNIGTFTAVSVFFSEIVLGLQGRAGLLQLVLLLSSFLGLPFFIYLAGRLEKHTTLIVVSVISITAAIITAFIPVGSMPLALCCYLLLGFASGAGQMLPRALMGDILDQTKLNTGDDQTGLYFSFLTTTLKLGLGLGVGVTFGIAGLAGFDPATARLDDSAHWVIRAIIGGFPIVLSGCVILTMWKYPLDRQEQQTITSALGNR